MSLLLTFLCVSLASCARSEDVGVCTYPEECQAVGLSESHAPENPDLGSVHASAQQDRAAAHEHAAAQQDHAAAHEEQPAVLQEHAATQQEHAAAVDAIHGGVAAVNSQPEPEASKDPASGTHAEGTDEIQQLAQQQVEIKALLAQAKLSLMSLEQVIIRQDAQLRQLGAVLPREAATPLAPQAHSMGEASSQGRAEPFMSSTQPVNLLGAQAVLRGQQGWGHHMEFLSAAKVVGTVTVIHALAQRAFRPTDIPITGILPTHVVIGNDKGHLYFFSPQGDLTNEHASGTTSPLVSIASLYARKNETIMATSHANGEVRVHSVIMESLPSARSSSRGRHVPLSSISVIMLQSVLPVDPRMALQKVSLDPAQGEQQQLPHVSHLHMYRQKGTHHRHAMMWFTNGHILIMRIHDGRELYSTPTHRPPIALAHNSQFFMALSSQHVTLTKNTLSEAPSEVGCEGLDGASIVAGCFDPARSYRAYAVSDRGDLLTLTVPSDKHKRVCKVVKSQPSGLPSGVPVSMEVIRSGYLILSHPSGLAILNVTSAIKMGIKIISMESVANLVSAMGQSHTEVPKPALGITAEKTGGFLAVSLGSGLVGFFDGGLALSLPRGMEPKSAGPAWVQPLMIAVMLVVGYIQFNRARRRSNDTGYTPRAGPRKDDDELFTQAVNRMAAQQMGMGAIPARTARRLARRDVPSNRATQRPATVVEEDEIDDAD